MGRIISNINKDTATVSLSLVVYKTSLADLDNIYDSILLTTLNWKLYVVDNSPTDELKCFAQKDDRITYIYNNSNIGFGAAHNIAIKKVITSEGNYHFIVNPDIHFDHDVMYSMIQYMQQDPSIGMMMPEILNEDGTQQFLPKLLPSPLSILLRKIKRPSGIYQNFINKYELRFVPRNEIYNTPILSGCFTLLNINAIREVGMYDDNFFMYFEDWDLSRRMNGKFQTIYFPKVSVYHGYESGANKSMRLFRIYLTSAIIYFNKWGWFFDSKRKKINNKTLMQFYKK